MARTLRAAVRSGVCSTRANLSFNARLAVFAEITDDLRNYLHSALASREAMSAVPEICRRDCAKKIPGAHQRIKSANFADLVSGLKRLRSAQGPLSSDEPMKAECKAQEQRIMTTKEKQREAEPMSPEARPAHRHYDYATRVQAHLAKHAAALALIQKTLAEITDPTRTYQSSEVYALINKRIERDRTFFDALRRLGFAGQSGFGSLTARDAGVAFAAAVKREYDGKPTKRERALAIKQLMCKLDVALSDIEGAS